MPKKKKDGRFINYYIDRDIYERFERYAQERGQTMTMAIERVLAEYLDKRDAERIQKGGGVMYCESCGVLSANTRCSFCGSKQLRVPREEDYCFLAEKDTIWSNALSDLLTDHGIPFVTRNLLGAGLAMKVGPMLERTRFYVPFEHYEKAKSIVDAFMPDQDCI